MTSDWQPDPEGRCIGCPLYDPKGGCGYDPAKCRLLVAPECDPEPTPSKPPADTKQPEKWHLTIFGDDGDVVSLWIDADQPTSQQEQDIPNFAAYDAFHRGCDYMRSYAWRRGYSLIQACGSFIIVDDDNPNAGILGVLRKVV